MENEIVKKREKKRKIKLFWRLRGDESKLAMEAAAAPPLSLPQQQRQAQPPQSLPFTRGEAGASSSGGGGNNSNTNQHHQTTHAARIAEAVARDLAALSNPDVSSPFASADDAIDRLLPYHVRIEEDDFLLAVGRQEQRMI